jgi:hypothetical protein
MRAVNYCGNVLRRVRQLISREYMLNRVSCIMGDAKRKAWKKYRHNG